MDNDIHGEIETNLRSLCGTSRGNVTMCNHDHSAMAAAVVDKIARWASVLTLQELLNTAVIVDSTAEWVPAEEIRARITAIEEGA